MRLSSRKPLPVRSLILFNYLSPIYTKRAPCQAWSRQGGDPDGIFTALEREFLNLQNRLCGLESGARTGPAMENSASIASARHPVSLVQAECGYEPSRSGNHLKNGGTPLNILGFTCRLCHQLVKLPGLSRHCAISGRLPRHAPCMPDLISMHDQVCDGHMMLSTCHL